MAFANLFTSLSGVDEEVRSPVHPAVTLGKQNYNGKRCPDVRKRKTQGEPTGPVNKKRYQPQASRTYNTNSFKDDDHMQDIDGEPASFTKEVIHNHSGKPGHSNMYHKVPKARNNFNVSRQQQWKKKTGEHKHQQQHSNKGKNSNRGGCHQIRTRRGGDGKQAGQVKCPRFMTEEFKDMNALLLDGRLLCKHFLWGRCIKGDDCQLEHLQGYNDLIKEVCKFYVQGFCTKGESCPYMHKSFPCKFFHRKGKCSQGTGCKFSHEPLDDVTKRLLDEAVKRDNDLYELTKKSEQESSEQPANTEAPEITEANRTSDILPQPLRPSFYNSGKMIEQEPLLCQTEHLPEMTTVSPQASGSVRPQSPPSANLNHKEPVCYSVEAMLGPLLFKPFPSFFTTPGRQDSAPLSVPQTSGSADQSEAPRSVDPLSSCKSVGSSTFGYIPTPTAAHIVSHTSKTVCEELIDPLVKRQEENKSKEKMLKNVSFLQVHTDLISQTGPNFTQDSGDHTKQGGEIPATLKPTQRSSCEVKLESLHPSATEPQKSVSSKRKGDLKGGTHLPMDITLLVNCKNDLPFSAAKGKTLTFTPKQRTQLKSHVSGLISNSQAPVKPPCPSSGFSQFEGAEPVTSSAKTNDSGNTVGHQFAAKRPTEIHQHSKMTQSGLKPGTQQHNLTESTSEGSSKMAHLSDVGCKETQKRPFYSLFASPIITDSLKPALDSVTACPQGLTQSSCPTPQSTQYRNKTDKTSATAFLSLFAAPLQCKQYQPDHLNQSAGQTSHLSDSKQRASSSETPLTHQVKTNVKQASHRLTSSKFSLCPKNENENFSEPVYQPTKRQVNPVCSFVSKSLSETFSSPSPSGDNADPSSTQAHQQLLAISPPKAPAVAATENSVLRTLFLCLSPYQQDGEQQEGDQISASPESEKDKSGTGCVIVEQQRKGKKKSRRKKKPKTQYFHQQLAEKTVVHSAGSQPSFQTSLTSVEATVSSTLSNPAMTESQVRNSGHNLPLKPVMQQIQHHTRPRSKNTSEERKQVNGNVAVTPLKDLFKTLDTTVFHLGH